MRPATLDPRTFQRRRPLFWLCMAFATGIALDAALELRTAALAGLGLASALMLLLVWLHKNLRHAGVYRLLCALGVALCGGMLQHAQSFRLLPADEASVRLPETPTLVWVEGTLEDVRAPVAADGRTARPPRTNWTLNLSALGADKGRLTPASGLVRLSLPALDSTNPAAAAGEGMRVRGLARLEAPQGAVLPADFDQARWLRAQGIRRSGEALVESLEVLGRDTSRPELALRASSAQHAARLRALFPPDEAALDNALLLGRREGIEDSDREAFARNGTAHLLSISGLHLNLMAALLGWLCFRIGYSKRTAALVVVVFSAGYVCLAGASDSLIRAAVMNAVYAGAIFFMRQPDLLNALGTAGLLLLARRPHDLFLAGFQLSFMSVFALGAILPALEDAWQALRERFWPVQPGSEPGPAPPVHWTELLMRLGANGLGKIRLALLVSFAAWAGTAPVVAAQMGFFSPATPLANLITVPFCAFAMSGGVLALGCDGLLRLFSPEGLAGSKLNLLFLLPARLLLGANRWAAQWPAGSIEVPSPPVPLLFALGVALLAIWAGRVKAGAALRTAVLLPAGFLALGLTGCFTGSSTETGAGRVTVLELPRGQSAWLELPGGAVLLDAGCAGEGRRIVDSLRHGGTRELALFICSEDTPECLGGALEVLQRLPVRRVILPRSAAPSFALRALRAQLLEQGCTPIELENGVPLELSGPGDARWNLWSDTPGSAPRAGSEMLAVRFETLSGSVLFARLRSQAAMQRLLEQTAHIPGKKDARTDTLVLTPGAGSVWPKGVERLLDQTSARLALTREAEPEASAEKGVDLTALAVVRNVRCVALRENGSLRVEGAHFGGGGGSLLAFRDQQWRELAP